MKQISTVTYGIDLGDEYSQLCVLDDDGEVVEEGRIRTSEEALRNRFASRERGLVVMEAGTHSPWVSRMLEELGQECLVANPASLHRRNRKKNDRNRRGEARPLGAVRPGDARTDPARGCRDAGGHGDRA